MNTMPFVVCSCMALINVVFYINNPNMFSVAGAAFCFGLAVAAIKR